MHQIFPLRETFFLLIVHSSWLFRRKRGFKPLAFHFVMFEQGLRQVRWFTVLHKPNKGIHDEKIT